MISSTQFLVEKYTTHTGSEWLFAAYEKEASSFMIEEIKLTVEVNSLYRNVNFKKNK